MSESEPYHQHISGVSTQNHSQAFVGSARDVYFAGREGPQDTLKKAADACRNALFLTDPRVDRERVITKKGTRVAGTCEWITRDESYRIWLNSDDHGNSSTALLWISGGPGKGKTMMSVFLTEQLEQHTARIDNTDLVFFFCSVDENHNTAVAVLRGLVYQIITKRPQLVRHALLYFETPERTQQSLSSLETLWLIFSELVADAELGTVFCVLDGLDECEESTLRALLPRLVGLLTGDALSSIKGAFKLVIVSREVPGLQGCTRIRLDPDNDKEVAGDIKLFVSARAAELSRIKGFNDDFQAYVQTALLQRAAGTFLWVGYAMHELLQKDTYGEIIEALENLPIGLPAIYSRMLGKIPRDQRHVSHAILQWVTLAVRPLQLRELAAATDIQPFSSQLTIDQAVRDAVALCGPLLKVQEQSVSLVHQSARDYLLRKERDSDPALETFRLNAESAHLELAQKCLDCIEQSNLQYEVIKDPNAELNSQASPLLHYATFYWPEHAKSCSTLAAKLFNPSTLFLQKESPLRDHWLETYTENEGEYQREHTPLLHVACNLELIPWVEAIVAKKRWRPSRYHKRVNEKDKNGKTALHKATERQNKAVVGLLVDLGADLKAKDKFGKTALHEAASPWRNSQAMVRLLVDLGADLKAKDMFGKTALHEAASSWTDSEAVVRLLVDLGADLKAKDKVGETALHKAAQEGNKAVVRLLVERGADVMAKDNSGRTVLHKAALSRIDNETVVRLLVERGADIMAKDKSGKTVLHEASGEGHKASTRLLIERGADVMAKDNSGKTVLHEAALSVKNSETVVRLLVERGADVMAKDKNGKTVLHSAVVEGNEAVVRLLIERGADVMAKDNSGKTVLHNAASSWRDNEAVVRLLVEKGADVTAEDKSGKTALYWAAKRKKKAVVQLLVEKGADTRPKDKYRKRML